MIKYHYLAIALIVVVLLNDGVYGFSVKEQADLANENFVLRYFLSQRPYDQYAGALKKTFTELFNMNLAVQEDTPRMLENIIIAPQTALKTRFDTKESVSNDKLIEMLSLLILDETDQIKKAFSKKLGEVKKEELGVLTKALEKFFTDYVVYHIKQEMAKELEQSLEDITRIQLNPDLLPSRCIMKVQFPEEVIEAVLEKTKSIQSQFDKLYNIDWIREYLGEVINRQITSRLVYYAQFFEFRTGGAKLIGDFAGRVMSMIKEETAEWDDSSVLKFTDLLKTTIHLNKSSFEEDTHQQLANFMVQSVFTSGLALTDEQSLALNDSLFKLFSTDITNESYKAGRQVLISYLFPEDSFKFDRKRRYLLERIYERNGLTLDKSENRYSHINKLNQLYIIDLLWVTSDPSFQISNADFQTIMENFPLLSTFDIIKSRILNYSDKLFDVGENEIDNYIEIYHSLYNLVLAAVTEWENDVEFTEEAFLDTFEAFLAFAKCRNFEIEDFNFHINSYYIIFKLINLSKNKRFFIKNDNIFLRFDAVADPIIGGFINSIVDIIEFLTKWKDEQKEAYKNRLFDVNMLNEMTIPKEFTAKYFEFDGSDSYLFI